MNRRSLKMATATLAAWAGIHILSPGLQAWQDSPRPQPGVAYGMPEGTEKFAAGTLIPYAGYNYVAQGDGTMMLAAQQPQARPLPPPRQPVAAQAANPQVVTTTRRIVYVPTTTVIRTVSPAWGYSSWGYGGYGGFGAPYGLGFRTYGWGGWAGPGAWGPFGPFGPPGFGPYIGFW